MTYPLKNLSTLGEKPVSLCEPAAGPEAEACCQVTVTGCLWVCLVPGNGLCFVFRFQEALQVAGVPGQLGRRLQSLDHLKCVLCTPCRIEPALNGR